MRRYLIDTGALSLILSGNVPDKWRRPWEEVKFGRGQLVLLEQLVCEPYKKNVPKHGSKDVRDKILWLKSLRETTMYHPDDNDAVHAGDLKLRPSTDLSIVDCFVLSSARANRATIITNDHSMRDTAKGIGLRVIWLPIV